MSKGNRFCVYKVRRLQNILALPYANSRIACLKVDIQTKPTIARFTHSPLDILSVEADVSHEQGKPVSVFIIPADCKFDGASIACLKVDIQTKPTIARFTHSPLDIFQWS